MLPVIDRERVNEVLHSWCAPQERGEYLVVPTFSTYPSNSVVQAYIIGGRDTFIVSDGGGAVRSFLDSGCLDWDGQRTLHDFVNVHDVKLGKNGWIYSANVGLEELTYAISVVTEASRDAAHMLLKHFKPKPSLDFRKDVARALEERFHGRLQKRGKLVGASNKPHSFDYVIRANDDNFIALDAVLPDTSSVNAAVVAHMDVKATHRPNIKQMIVYNDSEVWNAADLALLSIGAPTVAYSKYFSALERAAA